MDLLDLRSDGLAGYAVFSGMRMFLIIILGAALFTVSCADQADPGKSGVAANKDSLFHEVMEVHDAGMAKIGRLKKYSSRIDVLKDSLSRQKPVNTALIQAINSVKDSLDGSNLHMFRWMEEFTADTLQEDQAKRDRYLLFEKDKVLEVRDRIMRSIQLFDSLPIK